MTYKLTPRVNHTVELAGHFDAEVVDNERQSILKALRRRARVPGFRPGKAPLSLLQARFSEEIREELEERLSGMLWKEALQGEEDFQPLTAPRDQTSEFDESGSFSYSVEVEVRPRFELPPCEGLDLPEVFLEVSEEEVEAELEKLRTEQASWEPADDRVAEDGMLVEADLEGQMVDGETAPYEESDARFVLGEDGAPPEVCEALQGAKVGEERVSEKRFPEDDANQERAGKTVRYRIRVKGLKQKVLPEINDDLAKTMGFDSLDALRARVLEVLEGGKRAKRRDTWRRAVLDQLSEGIDLNELPSSLVQGAQGEEMSRLAYTLALQGRAPDSGEVDWQEMATRMEPLARRKVLDTLVLEQLADSWEIPVPEEEVDAFIRAEAMRRGIPPAEHKANLAKENKLEDVRHAARLAAVTSEAIRRAGGEVD